uniref:Uncharacterized protein n=1 Tax=Zea mays TaxID=4577 RepID=B6TDS4_MAIZE|nr:hypothetical protein [Zea mays]
MRCFKILLLVSLIPLVLRGVSLLGNVIPAPSPRAQPSSSSPRTNAAATVPSPLSSASSRVGVGVGRGRAQLPAAVAQRRFGGDGGDGFFRDDKRFSPTGSNPLHNL